MMRLSLLILLLFAAFVSQSAVADDAPACPHTLSTEECPFCTPALIESMGWCNGHKVPEAHCTRCNDYLISAFKSINDWCAEHKLPESQCALCNESAGICMHDIERESCPFCRPALIESMGWCNGHKVPEAHCTRCNDYLIPAFKSINDWCAEHQLPESQCLLCNPGIVAPVEMNAEALDARMALPRVQRPPLLMCSKSASLVNLASEEVAELAGFAHEMASEKRLTESVTCNASVRFPPNAVAKVPSRARGIVRSIEVKLGDRVEEGGTIAVIDSFDFGSAKTELFREQALLELRRRDYDREKTLFDEKLGNQKQLIETETRLAEARIAVSAAKQKLMSFGMGEREIEAMLEENDTSFAFNVLSVRSGVVHEILAVPGDVIEMGGPLISVAKPGKLWIEMQVPERNAARISEGLPVRFRSRSLPGENFIATMHYIDPQVDAHARILRMYAEVDNSAGRLRPAMIGQADILLHDEELALMIPRQAVQWEGCCNVVFVRRNESTYEPRKVALGYEEDGYVEVIDGLENNEIVVTDGSFLLKTEIMKGNIGAGCCEVDAPTEQVKTKGNIGGR